MNEGAARRRFPFQVLFPWTCCDAPGSPLFGATSSYPFSVPDLIRLDGGRCPAPFSVPGLIRLAGVDASAVHALAAGRPVVASAVGGIPEIVPTGAGVLVAPGDPKALADAVDRVAADTDGRRWMGKRARERYDEEFSAEDWADRLRSLYDEVLRRGR